MKNTLLSTYSTNILVVSLLIVNMKNSLTSKNLKMCDSILVTLLKTRPHYSQSSHENATPSSGTSLSASCKGVPPPGRIVAEMCRITTHQDTQHQGAGCAQVEVPGHTPSSTKSSTGQAPSSTKRHSC